MGRKSAFENKCNVNKMLKHDLVYEQARVKTDFESFQ